MTQTLEVKGGRTLTGSLHILDKTGDTKLVWDAGSDVEVENARRTFDDLRKKGFLAFAVGTKGAKGVQIREFDPEAERIIMAPPMAGG